MMTPVTRSLRAIAAVFAASLAAHTHAGELTVGRLRDIWPAFSACWRPPEGSTGMEMTLRFSLKRSGEILGEPRITYSKLGGPAEVQRVFRESVFAAVRECTPLKLSDELGGAIAGRPMSIRFIGPGAANARIGRYSESFPRQ